MAAAGGLQHLRTSQTLTWCFCASAADRGPFHRSKALAPAYLALVPSSRSISRSRLYLATRSPRLADPVSNLSRPRPLPVRSAVDWAKNPPVFRFAPSGWNG